MKTSDAAREEYYAELSILRSLEDEIPAGPGKSTVNMDDLRLARKEVARLQAEYLAAYRREEAVARWERAEDSLPF